MMIRLQARPFAICLVSIGVFVLAILLQAFHGSSSAEINTFTSGGYARATLGDYISLASPCKGEVVVFSGSTGVADIEFLRPGTRTWRSLGMDQYRFDIIPDCRVTVTVTHPSQIVSPFITGFLLWCSSAGMIIAGLFMLRTNGSSIARLNMPVIGAAFLLSLVVFSIVPPYLHNDQLGLGLRRDWGYRGWGYLDTINDIRLQLGHFGAGGLLMVQDFGKPPLLPFLAVPASVVAGTLAGATVLSMFLMALGVAGFAGVAYLARGTGAALVAAVLLSFNPIMIAYSASFYQETGLLAGLAWAVVFAHVAFANGSRKALFASFLCTAFAISSKHFIAAGFVIGSECLLLLYLRHEFRRVLSFCFFNGLAGTFAAIALWPNLWIDSIFRIQAALFGRVEFDVVHGFSLPLWYRILNEFHALFISLTPAECLVLLAVVAAIAERRPQRAAYPLVGIVLALLTILPSSYYLQHYLLYSAPFIALAGSDVVAANIRRQVMPVTIGVLLVLGIFWNAAYFPYVGMARLSCLSPQCSLGRFGPAEPAYGMREAAAWLRSHTTARDIVAAVAAPHTLQAYLPDYTVLLAGEFPANAPAQDDEMRQLGVKYLVENPWSEFFGQGVLTKHLQLVFETNARQGSAKIYRWRGSLVRRPPDIMVERLLPYIHPDDQRIQFIGDGAQVREARLLPRMIQISRLSAIDGPPLSMRNLGGGVIIAPRSSPIAAQLSSLHLLYGRIGPYAIFRRPALTQ
jgi:hypothetical protein